MNGASAKSRTKAALRELRGARPPCELQAMPEVRAGSQARGGPQGEKQSPEPSTTCSTRQPSRAVSLPGTVFRSSRLLAVPAAAAPTPAALPGPVERTFPASDAPTAAPAAAPSLGKCPNHWWPVRMFQRLIFRHSNHSIDSRRVATRPCPSGTPGKRTRSSHDSPPLSRNPLRCVIFGSFLSIALLLLVKATSNRI